MKKIMKRFDLQLFAEDTTTPAADAGITPDTTITATPDTGTVATSDPKTAIQADINTIKAAIADLQEKGEDLFSEEIANLNTKLANAETELEGIANDTKTEVKSWAEKFRLEHGISVPVAVVVGGYIVWQVAAAVSRVLGWF